MKIPKNIMVLGVLLWGAVAAGGEVLVVDDDGPAEFNSIQDAIIAAVDAPDTVILVMPGTYVENIEMLGKSITLTSLDPSDPDLVAKTIISGPASTPAPVIRFDGVENMHARIAGFTITNGQAGSSVNGGGIMGNGTLATIEDCKIRNNYCEGYGGGMADCQGLIQRCTVFSNNASAGGGVWGCNGQIINCLIYDNAATSGPGGGIANCHNGHILNCTITENQTSAIDGGGVSQCTSEIVNCIIWNNRAGGQLNQQISSSTYPFRCCIQNWSANDPENINNDPLFVDRDGFDNIIATDWDNNFRLRRDSPCIDAGINDFLVQFDIHTDIYGQPRAINCPGDDTGIGIVPIVDIGAGEWGFEQDIITADAQIEFEERVTPILTDPCNRPGLVKRIVLPQTAEHAVISLSTKAPGLPKADSYAMQGEFYPTVDDWITVRFKWRFQLASAETRMEVYLSDYPQELGIKIATLIPPEPLSPGGVDSDEFVEFRAAFRRGQLGLDAFDGLYSTLKLSGSEVWIDDWGVENNCSGFCGDYSADNVSTFMDFLFLNARYGMSYADATQNCLFLGDDGYLSLHDVLVWDEDNLVCDFEYSGSGALSLSAQLTPRLQPMSSGGSGSTGPLLISGRAGKAGTAEDYLYQADQLGNCGAASACLVPTGGSNALNGFLTANRHGDVYQVHAIEGLIDMTTGDVLFEPNTVRYPAAAPTCDVIVGMASFDGLAIPISDIAFNPCDSSEVYVSPVRVDPDSGCPYRAVAKLKLTDDPGNYTVEMLYGADPNEYSSTSPDPADCGVPDTFLYSPHLQGLHEIEIDPLGEWLYVLSGHANDDNNYVLIYDEDTGVAAYNTGALEAFQVVEGPIAMTLATPGDQDLLYIASSVGSANEFSYQPESETSAFVWRYEVNAAKTSVSLQDKIVIRFQGDPNRAICDGTSGLCASDNVATITAMACNPADSKVYVAGVAAPKINAGYCFNAGNQTPCFADTDPLYTTAVFAVIDHDLTVSDPNVTAADPNVTGEVIGGMIVNADPNTPLLLPVSMVWTDVVTGDLTADGVVDLNDLAWFAQYWLDPSPPAHPCADMAPIASDGDGNVDVQDLLIITQQWLNRADE